MAKGWSRIGSRFADFYRSLSPDDLWVPPRLRNREWMFMPWGDRPTDRHRSFSDKQSLHTYLTQRFPHSCFHSTAYYDDPSQRTMADKGWRGADLIFDLDGDHLHGISYTDFPALMHSIQEQAWSLWNDYLEPEFGFKREYAQFTFSGHRGFHIHLRDPSLFHLDTNARREIVTYIRGVGLEVSSTKTYDTGWSRRLDEGVERVSNILSATSRKEPGAPSLSALMEQARSQNLPVSKNSVKELVKRASSEDHIERLKADRSKAVFGDTGTKLFWALVRANSSVSVIGGETDENVTVDVKRVIRHLGSLHGKSGLRVTEIPFDRLDPDGSNPFDALREAVVFAGPEDKKVRILVDDVRAIINQRELEGGSGDEFTVDEGMAMFLQLKGWGELSG